MSEQKLVIVESPAKAQTIASYLGPGYRVEASVGHVRDLPQPSELPATMKKGPYGRFAVNVDDGFIPYYAVTPEKKKTVTALKAALKDADELYLATDEDREGEAIAWHLLQVLKPKVPVKRMVFHEITREAIQRALENTRDIDTHLVDAQETRRILDRLYGYEVSPLLWRKIRPSLSAGRVQSVATRLVVDREQERMSYVRAAYWSINTHVVADGGSFDARVISIDGRPVATGSDFNDSGELTEKAQKAQAVLLGEQEATRISSLLISSEPSHIESVPQKPFRRRPAAPFTTSTLQQDASRKLHWNASSTMRVAQSLYESGYITYMRTDSPLLSSQATQAAREQARELYGPDCVPEAPRVYGKKTKGAQEAHEAIRPSGDHFRTPDQVRPELSDQQFALYSLIWKRTIASQMTDAIGFTATIRVLTTLRDGLDEPGTPVVSSASGTTITHPGFRLAYEESKDKGRYDAETSDSERVLPQVKEGESVNVDQATDVGHETQPPGRYTEATLVKTLEQLGIGRPSTYAATIQTIGDRGYVKHRGQYLVPTWLAFSVIRLLEENLANLVDYDFTASMEATLDQIASGESNGRDFLGHFYLGDSVTESSEQSAEDSATDATKASDAVALDVGSFGEADGTDSSPDVTRNEHYGLRDQVASLGDIDARRVNSLDYGNGVTLRVGRYGPYLERDDEMRANVPEDIAPDELDEATIAQLFARAADDGRELGVDPVSGHTIIGKDGRFGPYVTEVLPEEESQPEVDTTATKGRKKAAPKLKPRTGSLFSSMSLATITLEQALQLLSLPREVGVDSASEEVITAQNGRYGPYLRKGSDSRTLSSEDQIFTITLEEALELYAQPKTRGRGVAKPPLREFGDDPISGAKVVVKDGRFGPYITDGKVNVTVPRSESVEGLTQERAFELLADKRAKGPTPKKTATRKTGTKRSATTKAKKPAAKKSTNKKA